MGLAAARLIERLNRQWEEVEGRLNVSFEFFPPNTADMEATLWQSVKRLARFQPAFVSVTYGAAASTRDRTHAVIERLVRETDLTPVPHLTCISSTRDEIAQIIERYQALGIQHIVALRGDKPTDYQVPADGFNYAVDLVHFLKLRGVKDISVAAYPEVHPEAKSARADLDNLKAKVEAGATRIITQFCFDNCAFLRFRDKCQSAGIDLPITPGILPVTNFKQVQRFASGCGTKIPSWFEKVFDGLEEEPETRRLIGCNFAFEQVKLLAREGVDDFHFYTLNRAELTFAICHALGLAPAEKMQFATAVGF